MLNLAHHRKLPLWGLNKILLITTFKNPFNYVTYSPKPLAFHCVGDQQSALFQQICYFVTTFRSAFLLLIDFVESRHQQKSDRKKGRFLRHKKGAFPNSKRGAAWDFRFTPLFAASVNIAEWWYGEDEIFWLEHCIWWWSGKRIENKSMSRETILWRF